MVRAADSDSGQLLIDQILSHVCEQYRLPVETVKPMLSNFVSVIQNHMNSLAAIVDSDDLSDIARKGHALKGALLNMGLTEAAAIAENVERAAGDGRRDLDYAVLWQQMQKMLEEIL